MRKAAAGCVAYPPTHARIVDNPAPNQVLCDWTMARRADALMTLAQRDPSLLTEALRSVLQRAPSVLAWSQLVAGEGLQASFEAVGSDGRLYSINVLTGTVLEDGAPPGRLPLEVLQHPLYLRAFGKWGFEVTVIGGDRRSISPVCGCFYKFWLTKGGGLHVVEEEAETGLRLELLDSSAGSWASELPMRLRALHAHWLSRYACCMQLQQRRWLHAADAHPSCLSAGSMERSCCVITTSERARPTLF